MNWKFWQKSEVPQQHIEETAIQPTTPPPQPTFGLEKAIAVYREAQTRFGDDETAKKVVAFLVPMVVNIMDGKVVLAAEAEARIDRIKSEDAENARNSEQHITQAQEQIARLNEQIKALQEGIIRQMEERSAFENTMDHERELAETVAQYFAS